MLTPRPGAFAPLLAAALLLLLAGCGWFSSGPDEPQSGQAAKPEGAGEVKEAADPFGEGMLKAVRFFAPANSPSQFLASLAEQFGWEGELKQNTLLRNAVVQGQFAEKVEPYLISVFFKNGFSVLPLVGDGHEFSRDSIVRGGVADSTLKVINRQPVRIIFLTAVRNIQIIYRQDGTEPQVFSPKDGGTITVRKSLVSQYLR